jgi:TP901 family phage tail tape measure protein
MNFEIAIGLQLFDNFSRQLFEAKESLDRFGRGLSECQNRAKSLSEIMKKAFDPKAIWEASEKVENFSARIAQATALPLAGMTKMLKDFSSLENARVEMEVAYMTKTGLPKEIESINKQIDELGIKLPGSAEDFYRVATALKSTGMEVEKVAGGGLKAASYAWVLFKSEASPEQVAEYMQEFSNAFKIPSSQFEAFVDDLQRLKFASGLSLTEIAYSTKYFSAQLNQLGVTGRESFKLMSAWIGSLKQFGLKGEIAGTSIRSVLDNIPKLDKNLANLNRMGISLNLSPKDFFDEKGAFKMEEFLIKLRDSISGIHDPIQRMNALTTLFDTEGMRAIAPLLAKNKEEAIAYLNAIKDTMPVEEFERLRKQIEEGGFSGLEEMAKRMEEQAGLQDRINTLLDTYANIWESLQGSIQQVAAVMGSLLAPSLKWLMNTINDLFGSIGGFIERHKTLSNVLAYTAGGFVSLLAVLGAGGLVIASFMKLMSFAFSPFLWLMRSTMIRGFTTAIFQNIIALIRWAVTGNAATSWLKALDFWLLKLKYSFLQALTAVKLKTVALWQWAVAMSKNVWTGLLGGLKAVTAGFRTATVAVRAFTITLLTNPIFLIVAGIVAVSAGIYLLVKHWQKVKDGIASVWNWLRENWKRLLQVFLYVNPITAPIMALRKLVQYVFAVDLFQAGKKIIESLWNGIRSFAMKPVEAVKGIVQKIRNLLPFSPAKEGPLRELHRIRLIETIAEAIKPTTLLTAMTNALEPVKAFTQPLIQPVKQMLEPARLAMAGAGPVNIQVTQNVTLNGAISDKEKEAITIDLRRAVEKALNDINLGKARRAY